MFYRIFAEILRRLQENSKDFFSQISRNYGNFRKLFEKVRGKGVKILKYAKKFGAFVDIFRGKLISSSLICQNNNKIKRFRVIGYFLFSNIECSCEGRHFKMKYVT